MKITETIIVVRHGESDANSRQVISSKTVDHRLTELGLVQAENTAKRLKHEKIDLVVSSTRERAQITGNIINKFHNAPMILTDDLIERDYGIFSGMDKPRAYEMMKSEGFSWLDIPESESASKIDVRVGRVVAMLSQSYAGQRVLISTHEDIVRSFYRVLHSKSDTEVMLLKIDNSKPHYFVPSSQ